jgi:hypothetical protein
MTENFQIHMPLIKQFKATFLRIKVKNFGILLIIFTVSSSNKKQNADNSNLNFGDVVPVGNSEAL